jgi:glutathione S-transferase
VKPALGDTVGVRECEPVALCRGMDFLRDHTFEILAAVSTTALVGSLYFWARFKFVRPPFPKDSAVLRCKPGEEAEKFILYQALSPVGGVTGSMSPFCVKMDCFLRAAKIPFESKNTSIFDSPKGKIPWGRHGSEVLCDSADMIEYVVNSLSKASPAGEPQALSTREADTSTCLGDVILPGSMDPASRALAEAVGSMAENSLYFAAVHNRWLRDEGFAVCDQAFFRNLPPVLGPVIKAMVRKDVYNSLFGQGIARHSVEDVDRRARADVDTIARALGAAPGAKTRSRRFLGGDRMCVQDCSVFGMLDALLNVPVPSTVKRYVLDTYPALVDYVDTIRAKYFPEAGPVDPEVREGDVFKYVPRKSNKTE